jgi:DNA polymerase III delta prime subunit
MSYYDFKQLSPHDFEELSRDLIQSRDGIILESFTSGRDGGIDFRHARATGSIIVQCKHYVQTGFNGLISNLKKEAPKAFKLNPSRYILITSVALTPKNKDDIIALFGDWLTTDDILGQDDINNLLGIFPSTEQKHYKLWLASRAVLDRVIHNASMVQSDFEVERVHRDIMRYVRSAAYPRAHEMLNSEHVAIISGPPGVGKTTLAKMLLYRYVSEGYEAVSILTDFRTGRERYQPGIKQIFYFDDFIGATFLGERANTFTRNEDRAILDFVEMVKGSPTARLILTTREHILSQAIEASEKLKHSDLISSRCVLEIKDYDLTQRAEILYNHIYFSDLPDDYRHVLLTKRFYREVVRHKKFNPRLIEWLATFRRLKNVEPSDYQDFVRRLLANPAEIWRHAYEQQISDAARSVLLVLYTYDGTCGPIGLETAFLPLHNLRAQKYGFTTAPSDLRRAIGELNGSFIRPGELIAVIDPSVLDMLNTVIAQDYANALDMIEAAVKFQQARKVWSFARKEGNSLISFLARESSKVAVSFERLMSVPRTLVYKTGIINIDDSIESRAGTVIQIAEALGSDQLSRIAVSSVDTVLSRWNSENAEISDGVSLSSLILKSKLPFQPSAVEVQHRILKGLVEQAATGCGSDELRELIDVMESSQNPSALRPLLGIAATAYNTEYFRDELHNCKSEADFEKLEQDISVISNRTNVSFSSNIELIKETKEEFEQQQSEYDDHQYDEQKERYQEALTEDRSIDDMFDSLRSEA